MASIVCDKLVKHYEGNPVVHDFSMEIADAEFIVLLGPSGCGKSTILRMMAGLEEISGGALHIGARQVNDLPPRERDIAMVFQNYALYPHMTVYDNMAFGLRRLKTPESEISQRVGQVAQMLSLEPLLQRKPKQMSGGQQQRVAIGRAMIKTPAVFLFDEPLSNLDAKLRAQLRGDIKRLHRQLATTSVYVTHDQLEAMTLADRIVLLKAGRIEQVGTPAEIYNHPVSRFAAGFIGTPAMNFIDCVASNADGITVLDSGDAKWRLPSSLFAIGDGQSVVLGVRPNHMFTTSAGGQQIEMQGQVDLVELLGAESLVSLLHAKREITALVPANRCPRIGDQVCFNISLNDLHVFDAETGGSLVLRH